MNPNVDLGSFRRGSPAAIIAAPGVRPTSMVAPQRRIFTRYVLPTLLLMGFAAVGLYGIRGSIQPTVPVRVVMPLVTAVDAVVETASSEQESGQAIGAAEVAQPVERQVVHSSHSPSLTYTMPRKGEALFQAPGWIEPEPYKVVVPALQSGILKRLNVLEGQRVTSGALVAELVEDDAILAVQQAEAIVGLKEAQYEAAKSEWQNPVTLTESINTLEAEALKLQAEKAKAEAQLELSTREAAAGQTLTRSGYEAGLENFRRQADARSSKSELQEIEARQRQNQAMLSAARERLKLRIEDRLRVAAAEAELNEARSKLAEARLRLERTKIYAQSDGVIMEVHVSPGMVLMEEQEQGMQIATMYDPENLQVRVDVPVNEAAKLRPGLPAEVRVDALPEKVYQGVLTRIVPLADVQRNVLPVKVHLFSPDGVLQPEMLAKVQFFAPARGPSKKSASGERAPRAAAAQSADPSSTGTVSSSDKLAVLVPEEVLHDINGDEARVWLAGADDRAIQREVKLGRKHQEMRTVIEGVNVADRLIASNVERLRPNIRIRIVKEKNQHATH